MNDFRNIIIAVLATALAVVVGTSFMKENTPPFSAVSSPILNTPYFGFGDVVQFRAKDSDLTAATTTVCALQSPAATSTLIRGMVRLSVSSTTASVVTLAKAATPYATTTPLNLVSVAANAQVTIVSSSTPETDGSISRAVFGPSEWLVVGMQGGISAGTFSPTGVCQATWEAI